MNKTLRIRVIRVVATMSILIIGIVIGRITIHDQDTHAQDRRQENTERRTFLSGGARSEKVLEEIDGTLKRIETRLESMEGLMKQEEDD